MPRKAWLGISLVILLLVVALVVAHLRAEKAILVGAILPLTGDVASYGIAVRHGIELAVDDVNAAGGIRGRPIKVIYEDDQAEPKTGVSAMQKLVSVNRVQVVIGAVPSSVTLAIAPVAERSEVVLISPASSAPKISEAGDFIFRNYPSDNLEGSAVAKFALEHQYKTCAVLTINNDYGNGLNEVFSKSYVQGSGKIVVNDKFPQGTSDFRTLLATVKAADPQCVFIVGYGRELGTLVKQAREQAINCQFLSTVNFNDPQSIATGGTAADGVIFSSPLYDPESSDPAVREFVTRFKNRFNGTPDVWAAHGYDAVQLVAQAMRDSGVDSQQIRDGLYAIKDFPGVSGITTFDANGDVIKPTRFWTVKNGRFMPY